MNIKRKLIKQGQNALTVTLPSQWTHAHHLKSGDEVTFSQEEEFLVLRAQEKREEKSVRIKFTNDSHRFLLANAYRFGCNEIIVTFENIKQLAKIQDLVDELQGFEITNNTKESVTIRTVAVPDNNEYPVLFRRTFHILQTAFTYLLEDIASQEFEIAKMLTLHKSLLRLSNFCKRVLQTTPANDKSQAYADHMILSMHDYCISELVQIHQLRPRATLVNYFEHLQEYFSLIERVLFEEKFSELFERKSVLLTEKADMIRRHVKDREVVQEAAILLRIMTMYNGPLSIRQLKK